MLPHALLIQLGHVGTVNVRQQPGLSLEALISRVGRQLEPTWAVRLVPLPHHAVQRSVCTSASEAHYAPSPDPQSHRQAERIHILHGVLRPHEHSPTGALTATPRATLPHGAHVRRTTYTAESLPHSRPTLPEGPDMHLQTSMSERSDIHLGGWRPMTKRLVIEFRWGHV
jgi:hypothetical protein